MQVPEFEQGRRNLQALDHAGLDRLVNALL
jgi:hypothetical protein